MPVDVETAQRSLQKAVTKGKDQIQDRDNSLENGGRFDWDFAHLSKTKNKTSSDNFFYRNKYYLLAIIIVIIVGLMISVLTGIVGSNL